MSISAQIASPFHSFAETGLAKVTNFTNVKKTEDSGLIQTVKFLAAPPAKIAVAAFAALETIARIFTLPVGLLQLCMGKDISEITAPVKSAAATILNAALSIGTIETEAPFIDVDSVNSGEMSIFKKAYEEVKNKTSAGLTFASENKLNTSLVFATGAALLVSGYIYWSREDPMKEYCSIVGLTPCNFDNFRRFGLEVGQVLSHAQKSVRWMKEMEKLDKTTF